MNAPASTFHLVFEPGTAGESRTAFTINAADIDAAIEHGRVAGHDRFESQMEGAAYHMIVNHRICPDDRIFALPWVVMHGGAIIARNHMAARIRAIDLG